MKYLCLVYLEPAKFTAVPDRECYNCGDRRYERLAQISVAHFGGSVGAHARSRAGRGGG